MKLPNCKQVTVPRRKVVEYLLSSTHPWGRHKADWFGVFGWSATTWTELAERLKQHAADNDVARAETTPFGVRYVIEGIMKMPDGRSARVRTVWFVDEGDDVPRFVTAYPLKGNR